VAQDPIALSLSIAVGLVFGTVGLCASRTGRGRLGCAVAGYALAAWHAGAWVLGGWSLTGLPLRWLLWAALVAVLVQSGLIMVRSFRLAGDKPTDVGLPRGVRHHATPAGYRGWNAPYSPLPHPVEAHRPAAATPPTGAAHLRGAAGTARHRQHRHEQRRHALHSLAAGEERPE